MSPTVALINGNPYSDAAGEDCGPSPFDRGLHFGDGLFETIACQNGRPRFLPLHLERLTSGCSRLRLNFSEVEAAAEEVRSLARFAERSIVKLIVTRGPAATRGYASTDSMRASRITIRYPWLPDPPDFSLSGVKVRTLSLRLGENPQLAGLKHCNRLEQILARQEWSEPEITEGLLFSRSGWLVSGTMTNLFMVRESHVMTPQIDLCGVAGIMRGVVLREAARADIRVSECKLKAEDLQSADEIFLTNARIGIWPVRSLDDRSLSPGAITRALQQRLAPLLEDPGP